MKSLKLNVLEQNQLKNQEMNALKGGKSRCGCACRYASGGGSSVEANANANYAGSINDGSAANVMFVNDIDPIIISNKSDSLASLEQYLKFGKKEAF